MFIFLIKDIQEKKDTVRRFQLETHVPVWGRLNEQRNILPIKAHKLLHKAPSLDMPAILFRMYTQNPHNKG